MSDSTISRFMTCLGGGCYDDDQYPIRSRTLGTRIYNMSDEPIELQIRVGSVMKKSHTVKPGSLKRLNGKSIYKAHMPGNINKNHMKKKKKRGDEAQSHEGVRSFLYYQDKSYCQPYVWIHDSYGGGFSRMVKQQYISLEDLSEFSEIRVYRDLQRGCISVRKKQRATDLC